MMQLAQLGPIVQLSHRPLPRQRVVYSRLSGRLVEFVDQFADTIKKPNCGDLVLRLIGFLPFSWSEAKVLWLPNPEAGNREPQPHEAFSMV